MSKSHREPTILCLIVLVAFFVRLMLLWVDRPEFVGWFNHTYYYYVETRGMLINGSLPYPDMPLLFYIYSITAKVLAWLGLKQDTAIVSATRFWMCLIPSLIPLVVFLIIRQINKGVALDRQFWLLIAASAILPLHLVHQPEFSQKNVLGMFLLFILIYQTRMAFIGWKNNLEVLLGALVVFLLITLTHFGTTGVAILYTTSLILAYSFLHPDTKSSRSLLLIGLVMTLVSLFLIYAIDIDRFYRIWHYLVSSFPTSFIGSLFSSQTGGIDKLVAATGIILPIILVVLFYRFFSRIRASLETPDQVFLLSNILFFYLLLLPVYDQLLLGRFANFLSIPSLIIIVYLLKFSSWQSITKRVVTHTLVMAFSIMAFGEYMSLTIHSRNNREVFADLMTVKQQVIFDQNDLIITKNGAEHICNWFLGTKSGVITALNQSDFEQYRNIYLLNPIEGELNFDGIQGKRADNEKDRYFFMLRNIPEPKNAVPVYHSKYIQLLKLESAPGEWTYDEDGSWISY